MIKSPGETQEIFLSCYNEGSFCYCNVFYSIDGKLSEEILPLSKDGLEFLLIGEIHVKSVDLLENIKFNPKLKFADG
ncbi:hypothetical protein CO154_02570 [Candidatus Pacearchaeota archaeon CG_4_9_14_3_um_filter_31_7]|nr:MAG: hypothetical protein CO154_02570 [Candidatus Pacearchaeota archaeon CG_4_9_14_3_um_filter_31_7]